MKKLFVFLGIILICFAIALALIKIDNWSRTDPNALWAILISIMALIVGYVIWDAIQENKFNKHIEQSSHYLAKNWEIEEARRSRRAAWLIAMDKAENRKSTGIATQYMLNKADKKLLAQWSTYTVQQLKEIEPYIFKER